MNKYIEVLIKQNPNYEIECENCKYKFNVRTKDIFSSGNTYTTYCPKCHKSVIYTNISSYIRKVEKDMKNAGIEIY